MSGELSREELARALAGDEPALTALVDTLTPVIQARVARRLLLGQAGRARSRDIRQEVEDLAQEIFLVLFADGARVLRNWNPEMGLSLANFVGIVAERQVLSILRSGKRSPWKEDPTLTEELDGEAPASGPEDVAASREELRLLLRRLHEELSPLGRQLFEMIFVHEFGVSEVVARTGMSSAAVYAWRSRLRRLAHNMLGELSETSGEKRRAFMEGRS